MQAKWRNNTNGKNPVRNQAALSNSMHQFHSFFLSRKKKCCIGLAPINFMILTQWDKLWKRVLTQRAICMVSLGFATVTNNTVQMDFYLFMIFTIFRDSLRTFVCAGISKPYRETREKISIFCHFSYHSLCVCISFSILFLPYSCWFAFLFRCLLGPLFETHRYNVNLLTFIIRMNLMTWSQRNEMWLNSSGSNHNHNHNITF